MEAVRELSDEIRDAVNGSPSASRMLELRVKLRESLAATQAQERRADEAAKLLGNANDRVRMLENDWALAQAQLSSVQKASTERIHTLEKTNADLTLRLQEYGQSMSQTQSALNDARMKINRIDAERKSSIEQLQDKLNEAEREAEVAKQQVVATEARTSSMERARARELSILEAEIEAEKKRRLELEKASLEQAKSKWTQSLSEQSDEQLHHLRTMNTELMDKRTRLETELDLLREQIRLSERRLQSIRPQVDATTMLQSKLKAMEGQVELGKQALEDVEALREEKAALIDMIRKLSPQGEIHEGLEIIRTLSASSSEESRAAFLHSRGSKEEQRVDGGKEVTKELLQVRVHASKLESELEVATSESRAVKLALTRSDRHRSVLEKERSALRRIIDGYEDDLSDDRSQHEHRLQEQLRATETSLREVEALLRDQEKQSRDQERKSQELAVRLEEAEAKTRHGLFASAEKSREEEDEIRATNTVVETLRASLLETIAEKTQLEQKVAGMAEMEHQKKALLEQTTELEKKMESLQEQLGIVQGTKILHMKDNPFDRARKEEEEKRKVTTAAADVAKLPAAGSSTEPAADFDRKRARMEGSGGAAAAAEGAAKPAASGDADEAKLRRKVEELEAVVAESRAKDQSRAVLDAEKRAQRTREIAKTKIEEFRLACYNLFGYKMQVNGAKYKLSSMYSDREDDILCFGRNESGGMELLETAYCSRLQEELDQYLKRWNSIPALLAHITSDNFQKTTCFTTS